MNQQLHRLRRDLAELREAAQALIAALDREDIWNEFEDQPVPIMQAAGEAVGRLRALLPAQARTE